jgi:hypothetical protein
MKTLAFGKITGREVYVYVNSTKFAPSESEWDEYIDFLRKSLKPGTPTVVFVLADGPPPTAVQRKKMSEVGEPMGKSLRVALFTTSAMVRGVVTALSWVGINQVAYSPDKLETALTELGVTGADAVQVRTLISRFKRELLTT